MAKQKHTTSTPHRATAAKATFSSAQAAEIICRLEDKAETEAFSLGHLSELMELFGEHIGTPYAGWSNMDMQQIGLRIEYLGDLVKKHAETIGDTVREIRHTAEQMQKGGAQ